MILDQTYVNLKNQVIKSERRVLKELGFCVHVKHPHKLIVVFLRYLGFDEEENSELMQLAWNYMNDSFRTDVFVRYQPETVACACIALAARKLNINMATTPPWYVIFKVQEDDLTDACYRIAELYQRTKPNTEKLEAAVDELKKQYQDQRKKEHRNNSSPAVTVVDRSNGSHNMWGGFISRQVPSLATTNAEEKTETKTMDGKSVNSTNNNNEKGRSRSASRSRNSRSRSRSDDRHAKKKDRAKKRTRSRSTPESDYDKKSRKR
jgi:cyclin L